MGNLHRSAAGLRILGDDLIPDEITRVLECSPTSSHAKGEQRIGRVTGAVSITRTGRWSLKATPRAPEDIEGQIDEILSKLTGDLDVWKVLSERYHVGLFCGLFMNMWNDGMELSARSLGELASRGIRLELDIYGPVEDESDDVERLAEP